MEILKGVIKKSIFIMVPMMAGSVFIEPRRLPLGIMTGWLIGIVNLRALSRNVMALLGTERATAKLVFMNMTRLLALFSAIAILVYYRIINIFGFLIGFTIVLLFVLIEGLKTGRER
jgi:hypothetical protein